jgi:hypothetical protein
MSRKKIIMIFDTWIVLWLLEGKRIRLTAESRRVIKAVESSSSRFCRPQQLYGTDQRTASFLFFIELLF